MDRRRPSASDCSGRATAAVTSGAPAAGTGRAASAMAVGVPGTAAAAVAIVSAVAARDIAVGLATVPEPAVRLIPVAAAGPAVGLAERPAATRLALMHREFRDRTRGGGVAFRARKRRAYQRSMGQPPIHVILVPVR